MRRSFRVFATVAFAVQLLSPALAPSEGPMGQREVEEALTCQCGCGLTVASCNHLECSFAVPVRKDIAESLARGEAGEQILERYKNEYGEKVLSSPVAEGFNLLAWIAPYLAIAVAGVAMFAFLRRRANAAGAGGAPRVADATGATPAGPADAAADSRLGELRREVDELER